MTAQCEQKSVVQIVGVVRLCLYEAGEQLDDVDAGSGGDAVSTGRVPARS